MIDGCRDFYNSVDKNSPLHGAPTANGSSCNRHYKPPLATPQRLYTAFFLRFPSHA